MGVPQISRNVRLVKPATAEMFDRTLPSRSRNVRLAKPATGDMSDNELPVRSSVIRLVANSSPVKSLTLAFCALRWVKVSHLRRDYWSAWCHFESGLKYSAEIGVGDVHRGLRHGVKGDRILNTSGQHGNSICSEIFS